MSLYPLKSSLPQALNGLYPCWVTSLQANICKAELMTFQLQARQTHLLCKHVFNCPPECSLYTNWTSMTDSRDRELYIDSDSRDWLADFQPATWTHHPSVQNNTSSKNGLEHISLTRPNFCPSALICLSPLGVGIRWDCTAMECPLAHWE